MTIDRDTGLSRTLLSEIEAIARKHQMTLVILFGSRARGDFQEKSDIDLAVSGNDSSGFVIDLDEETPTLLSYDVVNLDGDVGQTLLGEIQRDGIMLYSKAEDTTACFSEAKGV